MKALLRYLRGKWISEIPSDLKCLYVFETKKLSSRLVVNCSGSVNTSKLREIIAIRLGYEVIKLSDGEGARVVINNDPDHSAEDLISRYIRTGWWAWCTFSSSENKKNFITYAQFRLKPEFEKLKEFIEPKDSPHYQKWMRRLLNGTKIKCRKARSQSEKSAVVAFYHTTLPEHFQ